MIAIYIVCVINMIAIICPPLLQEIVLWRKGDTKTARKSVTKN